MEVTAWQQRLPAAAQLLQASMTRMHVVMLLALKHLADGGSLHTLQDALRRPGVLTNGADGADGAASILQVQQLLLHHGLMRHDGYEAVFLKNSAANAGAASSTSQTAAAPQEARAVHGRGDVRNSLAALLLWVSCNSSTGFLLSRVVDIADTERRLSEQV